MINADELANDYNSSQGRKNMARMQQPPQPTDDTRSEMAALLNKNAGEQRYVDIEAEQLQIENQSAL